MRSPFSRRFYSRLEHKYGAVATEHDGIKFPSQHEAKFYAGLKLRQEHGDVLFFLRQVPFHLPGGIKFVLDFLVFEKNGSTHFVETKGFKTPEYKLKKKQVEALYPIKIEER